MSFLQQIFLVTLLIEASIEAVAMIRERFDIKMLIAAILGGFLTWLFGLDFLSYTGLAIVIENQIAITAVNIVLMAIIFLRFSGSLNDVLSWLSLMKPQKLEAVTETRYFENESK